MASFFSKKPSARDQVRANDRALRKTNREVDRERNELERMEKKLELEIKQAAKAGNNDVLRVLARQLVTLRKQKAKTFQVGTRINSIGTQAKMMHSNVKIADAMSSTTKSMAAMGQVMDPMKTAQTMKEFERQNVKMSMTEEMISDTLDDIMAGSDDEEEEDAVVNQVLDEIGIEISGKLLDAPGVSKTDMQRNKKEEEDIEKQLAKLMSS